jgi:hypothetical protein
VGRAAERVVADALPGDVGVVEHDALGRAGGARGVDDRGQIRRAGRGHGGPDVGRVVAEQLLQAEHLGGNQPVRVVDDDHRAQVRQLVGHLE